MVPLLLLFPTLVIGQISFGGPLAVEESDCMTPHQKEGRCIGLRECRNVISLLKRPIAPEVITYLRSSVCGFSSRLPDVCCPRNVPQFGSITQTTTATSTTTTTEVSKPAEEWSEWSDWGDCIVSCGVGKRTRIRKCDGEGCDGEAQDTEECRTDGCPEPVRIAQLTQCGQTNIINSWFISKFTKLNAWPWIAALGYTNPDTGDTDYLCGATLISTKHVITAAHCVTGGNTPITVLLGEHILHNDKDGATPEEFNVTKVIKHEDYSNRTFENDIAIVEFETGTEYKKGIRPVCLPFVTPSSLLPPVAKENLVDEGVSFAGWGATGFSGATSDRLLQGFIKVVSEQECKEKLSASTNVKIDSTKICARDVNDRIDACQGGSGGPLMMLKRTEDKKFRYILIGIVSSGYSCAVKGFPGVYTRVSEYEDWIKTTLNNWTDTH